MIKKVTVHQAEGLQEECHAMNFDTERGADFFLGVITHRHRKYHEEVRRPCQGCYYKTDVTVELPSGRTIKSRHDVTSDSTDGTVRGHLTEYLEWILGDEAKSHDHITDDMRAEAKDFLEEMAA